jgi:hypothetical protein
MAKDEGRASPQSGVATSVLGLQPDLSAQPSNRSGSAGAGTNGDIVQSHMPLIGRPTGTGTGTTSVAVTLTPTAATTVIPTTVSECLRRPDRALAAMKAAATAAV